MESKVLRRGYKRRLPRQRLHFRPKGESLPPLPFVFCYSGDGASGCRKTAILIKGTRTRAAAKGALVSIVPAARRATTDTLLMDAQPKIALFMGYPDPTQALHKEGEPSKQGILRQSSRKARCTRTWVSPAVRNTQQL